MSLPLTDTITWLPFPSSMPPVVFEKGHAENCVPYFVAFEGKQVTVLIWHATVGQHGKWEWPGGKVFHGTVLYFASQPVSP